MNGSRWTMWDSASTSCAPSRRRSAARLFAMSSEKPVANEKIRLGGMALQNGVLVHGPTSWALAVRTPEGELKVASGQKRLRGANVTSPLLRGPARLADAMLLLPRIRRALPEARLPFERPAVVGAMLVTGIAVRALRDSKRLGPLTKELL